LQPKPGTDRLRTYAVCKMAFFDWKGLLEKEAGFVGPEEEV